MANIKTTFFFELTTIDSETKQPARETGWTESFVSTADSVMSASLITAADGFRNARAPILAKQGKCTGYRFHDLNTNATRAYPFNYSATGTGGDCTMPQIAMLARLYAQGRTNNRAYEMRGLPASLVTTGELVRSNLPQGALATLFNYICRTYGMIGRPATNPHNPVRNVLVDGSILLKDNAVGIAPGDTIKYYRVKPSVSCCGSLGTATVVTVAGKSITVKDYGAGTGGKGGSVAKFEQPLYIGFDQSQISTGVYAGWGVERSVVRKSGRPFDLFSGRRSRTCCSA